MGRKRTRVAFVGWIALCVLVGSAVNAEENARGKELFALCTQCHGEQGGGMPMALAPAIAGLDAWYVEAQLEKFQKGWRGGHPDDIAGMRMRPMSLWLDVGKSSHEDRKAVAEYVASLPPVSTARTLEGDPEKGKTLFAPCTACHGPDGKGNQALNAPSLVHSSDWYLVRALEKFKQGVRGWSPEDGTAQVMRGMAMSLTDEQAMKNVVAYIMSLSGTQQAKQQ